MSSAFKNCFLLLNRCLLYWFGIHSIKRFVARGKSWYLMRVLEGARGGSTREVNCLSCAFHISSVFTSACTVQDVEFLNKESFSVAGITADILLKPLILLKEKARKGAVCFSADIHCCLGTVKVARASQSVRLFLIFVIFGIGERRCQEEFNAAVRSGKRDTSSLKNKHKGRTRRFMACRLNNRKGTLWFHIYKEMKFPHSDVKVLCFEL